MKNHSDPADAAALSPDERRALLKQLLQAKARGRADLLSYGQRALWFMSRLAPESSAYNWVFRAVLRSEPDLPALSETFERLFERHDQLRSVVSTQSGEPVRQTAAHRGELFVRVDARSWSEEEFEKGVRDQIRHPFSMERGPLFRVRLFSRSTAAHVLLIVAHHIVMDARSLEILLSDASDIYAALSTGAEPKLSANVSSYADYVRWQEDTLAGERGAELRRYWLDQLSGDFPLLDLPTDRPRPTKRAFNGDSHLFPLAASAAEAVRELARAEKTTLFVIFVAAFQAFLSRYAGQKDILVGTPMAGRTQADFERVVGYFVNPVVLRTDLSNDPTFRGLIRQVRGTVLDAITHQDYPFPLLVEQLQPRRHTSHSPIFQAMIDWHILRPGPGPVTSPRKLGTLALEPVVTPQQEGQFDLSLDVFESNDALSFAMKYDVELFDSATIVRMARHFENLLASALDHPEQRVSALGLLDDQERQRVLVDWNDTARPYPRDKCVHQMFEEQAAKTPDAVAVVHDGKRLTYAELDLRASSVAERLSARRVGPDVPVGMYVEPSLEMLVGLLGILKAGGAYLPLDPSYPKERLEHMIQDSGTTILLTQERLRDHWSAEAAEVLCLDSQDLASSASADRSFRSDSSVGPENLAYMIYTSGSTGKPKGVQVPHRCVVNLLHSMSRRPGIGSDDVLLAVTTISFDIHALELFLPLVTGARVVVVDREVLKDGKRLLQEMRACGATIMQATPSGWQLLIDSGWTERLDLKVLCGGEPLPPVLARQLLERGREVWNMYGPTETTVWSSTHRLRAGEEVISIGRPIDNTQFYVLDEGFQPVPIGVRGELYIGGDGVARGYTNLDELTKEKFVSNTFSGRPGARLYATGDRARYRPDGLIEVRGRKDHQVKLRGFRIELGEIESALRSHAAVADAIATVQGAELHEKRLAGYLLGSTDSRPSTAELRRYLKERLPDYMVPSDILWLTEFPKAPNGKVDRSKLPVPGRESSMHDSDFEPPAKPLEVLLADIWREVLEIGSVSAYDNFFELGGHSLQSMKVVDLFERRAGHVLSPEELVNQTLRQIAAKFGDRAPLPPEEKVSLKDKLFRAFRTTPWRA